jgi:hypothetical protein
MLALGESANERLTGRRILRSLWVLALNGLIVYMAFASIFGEPFNRKNLSLEGWLEFLLKAAIPALGVLPELLRSRFARWVNVGFLIFLGIFYSAAAVWYWSDPYGGLLFIMGLLPLIAAGVTHLIYRSTA